MKYLITVYFILSFGSYSLMAQWSIRGETTEIKASRNLLQKFSDEEWIASNFATEQEMEWFNEARYGMFIHFGLSTYKEEDLSWGLGSSYATHRRLKSY